MQTSGETPAAAPVPIALEDVQSKFLEMVSEAKSASVGVSARDLAKGLRERLNLTSFDTTQCGADFTSLRKLGVSCDPARVRVENRGQTWFLVDINAPVLPYQPRPRKPRTPKEPKEVTAADQAAPVTPLDDADAAAAPARRTRRQRIKRKRSPKPQADASQAAVPQTPPADAPVAVPRVPRVRPQRPPITIVKNLLSTEHTDVELLTTFLQASYKPQTDARNILDLSEADRASFLGDITAVVQQYGLTNYNLQFDHGSRNRRAPPTESIICRVVLDRPQYREKFGPVPAAPTTSTA